MAGPEPELLLDPGIRLWVVLPVVLITFLVGVSRHFLGLLLQAERKPGLRQLGHSQFLIRSRALREHGKYLPRQSFVMRKHFFNDAESGFFRKTKTKILPKNPITDPSMLTEMMKGNVTHVLSMLIIGGWINSTFSGFVITKVPFPLTLRFKPMLQRGVTLPLLDPSWVSSASWYFLNVFGLRSLYPLILGRDHAANQMRTMQDQLTGTATSLPPDGNKAFKAEWEALELVDHRWALEMVEEELTATDLNLEAFYSSEGLSSLF